MSLASDLLQNVIRPTVMALGLDPDPEAACELLLGTAAQESGLTAVVQHGGGPALGKWQMEPFTYSDCWANFLEYKPELAAKIEALAGVSMPPASLLQTNDLLACAMARIKYRRVPAALPAAGDLIEQAAYYKQWYNTPLGAATVTEYCYNWHFWGCADAISDVFG